jgi:hypothetical protein
MSGRALEQAASLFDDLAAAHDADTWLQLYPTIAATNELLGAAMTAWKAPLQAELASAQQRLPRAWCAAAAAGLNVVVIRARGLPGTAPMPGLAVQVVGAVVTGLSQLLYQFHSRVVAGGGLQGREAALGMVRHFGGREMAAPWMLQTAGAGHQHVPLARMHCASCVQQAEVGFCG